MELKSRAASKVSRRVIALLLASLIMMTFINVAAPAMASGAVWSVTSPDSRTIATLYLDDNGALSYSVTQEGQPFVNESSLGLITDLVDCSVGLTFVDRIDSEIDEEYQMFSGKKSTYTNKANESVFSFKKDDASFKIVIRAYDDGIAFRYAIDSLGEGITETNCIDETTQYRIPSAYGIVAQPNNPEDGNNYEDYYRTEFNVEGTTYLPTTFPKDYTPAYDYPALINATDGRYMLIGQAQLTGSYNGRYIVINNNVIGTRWANTMDAHGNKYIVEDLKVTLQIPFESPWRFIVIGTPDVIFETEMLENLNPANVIADTSWIKPGLTSWTWLNKVGNSEEAFKEYIDLSASMGWGYILLDAGWKPWFDPRPEAERTGMYVHPWFPDLVQYANDKGIGIIVWAHTFEFVKPDIESLDKLMADYQALGIKGLKIDFFDGEIQSRLKLYDDITKTAANHELLLNFHGSNIPNGQRRTYPNILNAEAVRGGEWTNWESYTNATQIIHYVFMRNVMGPMDFTPLIHPLMWRDDQPLNTYETTGFLLSLSILQESGLLCMGDLAENYREPGVHDFLLNLPGAWDDSKLLAGTPGNMKTNGVNSAITTSVASDAYAVVARRYQDLWYVGAASVSSREIKLPLDFLSDGTYQMDLFTSTRALEFGIKVSSQTVSRSDVLDLSLLDRDGLTARFTPVK